MSDRCLFDIDPSAFAIKDLDGETLSLRLLTVPLGPDMEAFQANLTALWRQIQEMRENGTCRPQVDSLKVVMTTVLSTRVIVMTAATNYYHDDFRLSMLSVIWTKWPSFCKRHFQMDFRQRRVSHIFLSKFH